MSARIRSLLLLGLCLALPGCGGEAELFPLRQGMAWRYEIRMDLSADGRGTPGAFRVDTVLSYVDGIQQVDGREYVAVTFRGADQSVEQLLYRRDDSTIWVRPGGSAATTTDVLFIPRKVAEGQTWMMPRPGAGTVAVTVGGRERFAGPAGQFEDCRRLQSVEDGWSNYTLLCPGVGTVSSRYRNIETLLIDFDRSYDRSPGD